MCVCSFFSSASNLSSNPSNWTCCKPSYRQVAGDTFLVSSYEVTGIKSGRTQRETQPSCRLFCASLWQEPVASVFVCVCVCARASSLEDRRFSFAVILFRSHNMLYVIIMNNEPLPNQWNINPTSFQHPARSFQFFSCRSKAWSPEVKAPFPQRARHGLIWLDRGRF